MATFGTACASVKLCRREFSAARETRPYATIAMARSANTTPARRNRRGTGRPGLRSGWDIACSKVGFRHRFGAVVPVNNAEHHRDEEQRGDGGEDQAADHGTAE